MQIINFVGIAAAVASTASFAPQAWKIIRSRDVTGLSAPMYLLTVVGFSLWLTYGVLKQDWALMVPNALCLALASFIFAMILLPRAKRERIADTVEAVVAPDK